MSTKYLFKTALCALATIVSACSNEELVEQQTSDKQITMTASDFKYDGNSRTSINITPNGGKFTWAINDTVGIFPNVGTQAAFPMSNGAGTKTASFNGGGWALKPSSTYAAYYPFVGNIYLDKTKIPVNFEGQTQVGNSSTDHLGKYDYMAAIAKTPNNGNVNFEFKHLCALVELNISVPNKGDLTSVTLSSEEAIFTTKGSVDLTSTIPQIKSESKSKFISVNLRDVTTFEDNKSNKVYFMVAPIDLIGKTIIATIVNNGVDYEAAVETKNLEAGKLYSLTVSVKEQKPVQDTYNVKTAGSLPQLIGVDNKFKVTKLKLSGELNSTDIKFIREMAGCDVNGKATQGILNYLDIYDTRIVKGGDYYYTAAMRDYYTSNDILSDLMFYGCSALTNLILPKSITSIEPLALGGCNGLTEISIPSSVTSIGLTGYNGEYDAGWQSRGPFSGCSSLTKITIPNSVQEIGYAAFMGCNNLTNLIIPNSVTSIGLNAFSHCNGLTKLTIPNSVTSIGANAFYECKNLQSIALSNKLAKIQYCTFEGCENLIDVVIPLSVKSIDTNAFKGCKRLSNFSIPNSVTSIGSDILYGCDALTTLTVPSSVTILEPYAFRSCPIETLKINANIKILLESVCGMNIKKLFLTKNIQQIRQNNLSEGLQELYCFATTPPIIYSDNLISTSCKIFVPKIALMDYKKAEFWKDYSANIFEMPEGLTEP